jgi:p-cumate 2,3-dioxygenase beta subunit
VLNVRVLDYRATNGGEVTEVSVTASFTVWRFRGGRSSCYVGRYRYLLRITAGGIRIARKRAELDMTDLRAVSDVAIIL